MIALSEKPNMTNGSPAESATEKRTADAGTVLELQRAASLFAVPLSSKDACVIQSACRHATSMRSSTCPL